MDWRKWRDRWLGDPALRARIGRWPIGRRIAAYHARDLFGIVAGFAQSQMLAAAVDLGVFERLRQGPRHWREVTDLPSAGAAALRQALIAIGLIEARRDGRVALTVHGLVVATDPGIRAMIVHNRLLYADLADPVATLRGAASGAVAGFWPYAGGGKPKGYSALMDASSAMVTDALVDHPVFAAAHRVMDVGGGHGGFLRALRRRRPDLALTLVDLPPVVAGLDLSGDRIAVHPLEPAAPLPVGADTVTLVRVLHDLDASPAATLLARVAAALPVGGRIVVAEPMAMSRRDPQTAYFAAYFSAMRSGRLRSPDEVARLLTDAGFDAIDRRVAPPLSQIVTGRNASSPIDV